MPLIRERSVWELATKLASEHGESFRLVCAEILTAIDRGELPATAPHEKWLHYGPIPEIIRNDALPLPPDEGVAILLRRVMVRDTDIQNWLNTRLSDRTRAEPGAEAGACATIEGLVDAAEAARAPAKPAPPMPPEGGPGRKPGSGTIDDGAAIKEMLRLLAAGSCSSVWAAAGQATEGAHGASPEATRRRLYGKFRKRFGTSPPPGKNWADIPRIENELNSNSILNKPSI
jgi:hypothetical protein